MRVAFVLAAVVVDCFFLVPPVLAVDLDLPVLDVLGVELAAAIRAAKPCVVENSNGALSTGIWRETSREQLRRKDAEKAIADKATA